MIATIDLYNFMGNGSHVIFHLPIGNKTINFKKKKKKKKTQKYLDTLV